MAEKKKGIKLNATVQPKPGNETEILFTLPDGRKIITKGPNAAPEFIGPIAVTLWPDQQFVQILLPIGGSGPGVGVYETRIPLADLPQD